MRSRGAQPLEDVAGVFAASASSQLAPRAAAEVVPSVVEVRGDGGPVGWLHGEGGGFLLDGRVFGLLAAAEEVVLDRDGEVREPG